MDERMKGMDVAVLGMKRMDVAVLGGCRMLGGGPAGLAAALALRQRGCRVALYDGQRPPIDKACGEGLMPEAVRRLHGLGVAFGRDDGAPMTGISFHDAQGSASAAFGEGAGLAVRRTRLQSRMAARAAEMGVEMHWGACVSAATDGGFASAGKAIRAEFFVIADGLCSTLAAASGFRERTCHSTRYARRQQFQCAPWSNHVEVYWGSHEQLYVTALGDDEVGVALLTTKHGRRLSGCPSRFSRRKAKRIAGAARASCARGAVTKTRSLREVVRGGNVAVQRWAMHPVPSMR